MSTRGRVRSPDLLASSAKYCSRFPGSECVFAPKARVNLSLGQRPRDSYDSEFQRWKRASFPYNKLDPNAPGLPFFQRNSGLRLISSGRTSNPTERSK